MFRIFTHDSIALHPSFRLIRPGRRFSEMPMGFLDIGARGGAHDMVEPVASCTAVLGFEPDEAECARLLANPEVTKPWARIEFEPVALANKKDVATLHLLSAATNHSLLPPNEEFTKRYNMVKWQLIGQEPLSTVKLDDMLFGKRANEKFWGEFIKIDTQGTEYEILEGARKTLRERTVAVVCEVAFCELYKGQRLFSEVESLLREEGFSFYGFTTMHTRSQKLLDKRVSATAERAIYSDAIFFKDPLPGGPKPLKLSPRQVDALFISALLLNFYDFALELARATWLKEASVAENEAVTHLVLDLAQMRPETTLAALEDLLQRAREVPELANVCAGNFVDRRRRVCDFDDVLNISPLPKTL